MCTLVCPTWYTLRCCYQSRIDVWSFTGNVNLQSNVQYLAEGIHGEVLDFPSVITWGKDLEEVRHLSFDLGGDYDNLGGRGKAANAGEPISLLEQQQQLPQLLDRLRVLPPTG
jgi:hypothetical protein